MAARAPDKAELADLRFAWAVEAGVTSNSVIFARDGATLAIGTGEQDRVGCVELAVHKAYTKYADTLAFKEQGLSLYDLKQKAAADPSLEKTLVDIGTRTREGMRRPDRLAPGFRRLFPLQGRRGRGHCPGRHGHCPAGRVVARRRGDHGLQRGAAAGGDGLYGSAFLQALASRFFCFATAADCALASDHALSEYTSVGRSVSSLPKSKTPRLPPAIV